MLSADTVLQMAARHGFDLAGIADLREPLPHKDYNKEWITSGQHGSMQYLARTLRERLDPGLYLKDARSAVVLGVLYRSERMDQALEEAVCKVARYAGGRDYHKILKKKAYRYLAELLPGNPTLKFRICVDTAPVAEKLLAARAGLGFQGKNTLVIHPGKGSYFFLVVILLDQQLQPTPPVADGCGQCRRCIDACPTRALKPYQLDARRCISYRTIEDRTPGEFDGSSAGWVFGCDICQEVCPYNRKPVYATHPAFQFRERLLPLMEGYLEDENVYEYTATGSALRRAGYEKLKSSVEVVRGS
ncbi:MAG: tRNA epoxyqueuosine(34) reductase QueG [Spirochaetales bacterium]|nr:tRNA epoxyqueuosine(34) reductase QueG [Spirochaetales bacterium]